MIGFVFLMVALAAFYIYIYRPWSCIKKITFLSVGVYLLLGLTILMLYATVWTVGDVREKEQEKMLAYRLEEAKDDDRMGFYAWMASEMELSMDYEEEFEYLWERLIMYTGSNRYQVFAKAAEAGLGEAYVEQAYFYRELLESMCLNTGYEANIPYGKYYLKRAGLTK